MLLRELNEEREQRELASFALKSANSRGRVHPEGKDRFRTVYLRDRDRIIHSSAFRRLEYKTQVFISNEGDYYRTRLTHTLEVSQIARSVAFSLRFNEGFVEALALAHDLGHAPFGHTGEDALNGLMKNHGGFEHNRQALRIVDTLERKYIDFDGLNISHELREAMAKHGPGAENTNLEHFRPGLRPFLETQIVNISDQIAYQHHDLDDGLRAGILKEEELMDVPLWREANDKAPPLPSGKRGRIRQLHVVNTIAKILIGDLTATSHEALKPHLDKDAEAMRKEAANVIGFSVPVQAQMDTLQDFLNKRFYGHHRLARVRVRSERILKNLFEIYRSNPRMLPPDFRALIGRDGTERSVCDYISGMTDRFALDDWKRFQA
jgi:dGTPase